MTSRYFRTASDELYEHVRLTLDDAWGHPTGDGYTLTCIAPAASAPRDDHGRIVLAVRTEFTQYSVAVDLLPPLLASGAVEEITEAEYMLCVGTAD